MPKKIAIIGAGLAGLTAATQLNSHADITVFDKSRGVGGRMSTRYAGDYEFDHGAQYFTARSEAFQQALIPMIEHGIVTAWPEPDRFVAAPRMNSLGKYLAQGLNVHLGCRITDIKRTKGLWNLTSEAGDHYGPFDWVIAAAPQPQTLNLLPENFAQLDALKTAKMLPAFTQMIGMQDPWPLDWDYKRVTDSPIAQISINSNKPGRKSATSIVIQADNHWAAQRINLNKEIVTAELLACFEKLTGGRISHAPHKQLHRWLYANIETPAGQPYLIDTAQNLTACGDWCIAGRVEAAFTSGYELAQHLKTQI